MQDRTIRDLLKTPVEVGNDIYGAPSGGVSYPQDGNDQFFHIEDHSFWFKHRNACIHALVSNFFDDHSQQFFLDIGGGNGFVSKMLQDNGVNVVMVEPGLSGALNAQARGVKNIICGSCEDLRAQHSLVSAVGLFDVIEHIPDDFGFLRKIYPLLPCGGQLFITAPSYPWLWSSDDKLAGHFRRHTDRSLRTLLRKTGFETNFSTYFFSLLVPPVLLLRTIPSALRLQNKRRVSELLPSSHGTTVPRLSNLLNKLMSFECSSIKKRRRIPFGSSLLLVARKLS